MHTNNTENANPLNLNESCTDRKSSQKGHKNSKRNINIKSAVITMAQSIRNFMYRTVVLPYMPSVILLRFIGRRSLPQSALRRFILCLSRKNSKFINFHC